MIRCRLAILMGERKLRIADVARETGLSRGTITAYYKESAIRVELGDIDLICGYLECEVGELFERVAD